MPSTQPSPSDSVVRPLLVVVAFALGILLPSLGMLAGFRSDIRLLEYRDPAPLPTLFGEGARWREYPNAMNAYLDDHFGFRSTLLSLNSRLHLALGVSPAQKFMVGLDDWYFLRGDEHGELANYRGTDRFTPDELERWIAMMESRQQQLAAHGVRFVIAVAPSKHEIYPEYVPAWANVVEPIGRYEQLAARIAAGSTLELIDLHEPLRSAKLDHRVYHKTDGHWNELGAYFAYKAIVAHLHRDTPAIPLRPLGDFDIKWATEPFGVITRRLNVADRMPEEVPHLRPKQGTRVVTRSWPEAEPSTEMEHLYLTQRIQSDPATQGSVLFLRDSFATDMGVFAQESFRETVLLHHRFGRFRKDEVLSYNPDVVVYELLERGLAWELRD